MNANEKEVSEAGKMMNNKEWNSNKTVKQIKTEKDYEQLF